MHTQLRCLLFGLVAGAAVVGAAVPALSADEFDDPAARTRKTVLDNGLTVLTLADPSTPVVSFQMWVKAGSRDETRYTGIAHLFEHMMFKGSDNLAPEMHARLVEERGGRMNAFTSRDVTVYFEDVPADALPLVIDLEHERVAHLDISEETLSSEREVVLEERRMRTEDSPEGLMFEALLALSFRAHPYRWPVIGWRSDVEAVPVEACREFFDAYYAPNNLVLAIVGPFDEEATLAHIERTFGRLEPAEVPRTPRKEPPQRGARRDVVRYDVRGSIVAAAWHAPAAGHEDGPALDVLSLILSGGRSSRLYQRMVRQDEIALDAGGGYWELEHAGVMYFSASVRPGGSVAEAEATLLAELERTRDEPVTQDEVDKAKRQLEVDLVGSPNRSHALASRIARDTVTFGHIRSLDERLSEIRAVSVEDVQRVARTYLVPEGRSVVTVVPPEESR